MKKDSNPKNCSWHIITYVKCARAVFIHKMHNRKFEEKMHIEIRNRYIQCIGVNDVSN